MSRESGAILILGGGLMQLPAIREAGEMGVEVHVADGNHECRCRSMCDVFHHIDLRDAEGLTSRARAIPGLRGVFTAGTDFSVSVALIAEALGLPGIPYQVSLNASDKGRMRRVLAAAGVSVPRFEVVPGSVVARDLPALCDDLTRRLGLPLVCKPVDNMGARGVQLVPHGGELAGAITHARRFARSGDVIVERKIEGAEFSLDALVEDSTVYVTGVAERHIFFPPWFVELGHSLPADLSAEHQRELESTFRCAIQALGITRGAAKGDIFLVPASDGTSVRGVVGEVAARLSGGFMSGWTYPLATGVPLTRAALRIALGEPIDPHELTPTRSQVVVERAAISAPGRVSSIEWAAGNASRSHGKPVDTFLHCRVGDEVEPPRNNVQKVANVIAVAADRGTAETLAVRSLDQLRIRLVPDNPETDAFIFRDGWRGPFARYELSDALNRRLDSLAPDSAGVTAGNLSEHRVVEFGGAIPVEPLTDTSLGGAEACRSRYPSIDASQIVAELLQTDRIRFEHGFSALGSAFWSALLSAGRQGVDYFLSAVERGSLRIYDTVNRAGSS